MDPASAVADLTEISAQVLSVVVFEGDGSVLASTWDAGEGAARLARIGRGLLAAGAEVPLGDHRRLTQVEVVLASGSVFVVSDGDRGLAATAAAGSPSGLVLYDLRSCLRALGEPSEELAATPSEQPSAADA
ncbi:MAG: hypothetical protein H0U07_03110 [Actinobacteria bacterium]|nr:hypothetical protein [Actinomycetota bacterium]